MIRNGETLRSFERSYARAHGRTFEEALRIFDALWREAAALNPDFPGEWREDLEPDLSVARAIHESPPSP